MGRVPVIGDNECDSTVRLIRARKTDDPFCMHASMGVPLRALTICLIALANQLILFSWFILPKYNFIFFFGVGFSNSKLRKGCDVNHESPNSTISVFDLKSKLRGFIIIIIISFLPLLYSSLN